jgi:hypothetical protein
MAVTSPKLLAKIQEWEVGSEAVYDRTESHPTWPGGDSGVTIGIGSDLGYTTVHDLYADWQALPVETLNRLRSVVGLTGTKARDAVAAVKDVIVPWQIALQKFMKVDVPNHETLVRRTFQNTDALSDDCFGCLVSLVFNRGASMSDPPSQPGRRLQMRQIRDAMEAQHFGLIPGYFEDMARIWESAGPRGLVTRYNETADLFRDALIKPVHSVSTVTAPTPAQIEPSESDADKLMEAELRGLGTFPVTSRSA